MSDTKPNETDAMSESTKGPSTNADVAPPQSHANPAVDAPSGSPAPRSLAIGSQRSGEATNILPDAVNKAIGNRQPIPTPRRPDSSSKTPNVDTVKMPPVAADGTTTYPPPRVQRLPQDLQQEIDAALDGVSLDDLMNDSSTSSARNAEPKLDERYPATVVMIHRDDIFFSLPGQYEGMASMRQFDEPPEVGDTMEVVVRRFNREEGLYELSVPGKSISVADWSDLDEGTVVEAVVTGHNSGGLECEVNKIRAFMPISQISMYRVENIEEYVGERFPCVVTEANQDRRNLVLSRRAVLERERAEAKEELMKSLKPGQEFEGTVRSIRDFGAFVDLGGVDGLVHIKNLSWDRIGHPSEVVKEGEKIKVKIERIDETTGKISLSYRDTLEQPWQSADAQFPIGAIVTGTVSKIMDFGAFVRLAAGIEGLVHVSELAHHRVSRVDSIVQAGQEVTVKVLSVDAENQRMSLSIKAVQQPPETGKSRKPEEDVDEPPREKATKPHEGPLRGGTNRPTGGESVGLNW